MASQPNKGKSGFWALVKNFVPPRFYCWQTVLWLSIFSVVMSGAARLLGGRSLVSEAIALGGSWFLFVAVAWGTRAEVPKIAPELTALLASSLLFLGWSQPLFFMALPVIAVMVRVVPDLTTDHLSLRLPQLDRRYFLLILVFAYGLLTLWTGFYFVSDRYGQDYPSTLFDDWRRGQFFRVVRSPSLAELPGARYGAALGTELRSLYNGRPWSVVQRLAMENPEGFVVGPTVAASDFFTVEEQEKWQECDRKITITPEQIEVTFTLEWQGIRAHDYPYVVQKTCGLGQNPDALTQAGGAPLTRIECQPSAFQGWTGGLLDGLDGFRCVQ